MATLVTRTLPVTIIKASTTLSEKPAYCKLPVEITPSRRSVADQLGLAPDNVIGFESIGTAMQKFSLSVVDFIKNSIEEKEN